MTDDPDRFTRAGRLRRRRPRALRAIVPGPEMLADAPEFAPAPVQHRHDGWTYARQRAFVAALAETGCVERAARRLGMTAVGAYRLRRMAGAEAFARAWDEALQMGVQKLTDIAFDRAINGVPVPVFYKGEQVGERRSYNDRLLMFTLRHHDPERYGGRPDYRTPPQRRRAGAAGAEEEELTPGQQEARARAAAAKLARLYRAKAADALRCRREGRHDEAEFTLRQLTHIEVLLVASELRPHVEAIRQAFPHPRWDDPLGDAEPERAQEIAAACRALREAAFEDERPEG